MSLANLLQGNLRQISQLRLQLRRQRTEFERFAGRNAQLGHAGQDGAILGSRRRVLAHQLGELVEIDLGAHAENHVLRLVRHAEARIRVDGRRLGCIGLTPSRQRSDLQLRLQGIDRRVITIGAIGVGPPQDQHLARGRLYLRHALGRLAFPAWPGQQVVGRAAAGGTRTRRLEDAHPQVVHRHQEIALAHIGLAEHLRFTQVHPGKRVEGIGVRRGHPSIIRRRIAFHIGKLPHGRMCVAHFVHVGHLHARDLGGDQRITVDVGFLGNLQEFIRLGGRSLASRTQADGSRQQGG
ncbi:hypothetical protein D9M69_445320 [compost metagenome]